MHQTPSPPCSAQPQSHVYDRTSRATQPAAGHRVVPPAPPRACTCARPPAKLLPPPRPLRLRVACQTPCPPGCPRGTGGRHVEHPPTEPPNENPPSPARRVPHGPTPEHCTGVLPSPLPTCVRRERHIPHVTDRQAYPHRTPFEIPSVVQTYLHASPVVTRYRLHESRRMTGMYSRRLRVPALQPTPHVRPTTLALTVRAPLRRIHLGHTQHAPASRVPTAPALLGRCTHVRHSQARHAAAQNPPPVRLGGARRDDHRCRVGSPVGTESDMQLKVAEVGAGAVASPAAARMCTPAGVRMGPCDDPLRAVWL